MGKAEDGGDFVHVHVHAGVGNARGAHYALKRGREGPVVQRAFGDDRDVDPVIGLADLVLESLEMRKVVGRIAGTRATASARWMPGRASNSADVAAATAIRGYCAGLYRWEQRPTGDLEPAD